VVILVRECIETARTHKQAAAKTIPVVAAS
jgi:hypothetical protein